MILCGRRLRWTDKHMHQQDLGALSRVSHAISFTLKVITYSSPHWGLLWHPLPLHCGTVLTRASFIKNTDVAGRTSPGPLFCALSTVERNSIFQGDDVRSANMEAGDWEESRCRVAEVAGMFWPHIICCDSSQDNACTWSIWQNVRYRFTLCVGVVRRASVQVKRQNNVMRQEAALQKRLFRTHKPRYHLSQNASLWRNGHPKCLVFFPQKSGCFFFLTFLFFLFSGVTNTEQHTAYWLILFGFLTRWIFMSPGLQFFIRFHTHAKIQATQADRIIPFNGWEMNRVKYALFYSLIASLGWGNWVPPSSSSLLTEWIMTSSDPRQALENLDRPLFKQKGILVLFRHAVCPLS